MKFFINWLKARQMRNYYIGDIPLVVMPYERQDSQYLSFQEIEQALITLGFDSMIGEILINRINAGYIPKLRIVLEETKK